MAGPPYVSHVKLYENSHSAMLAAIELFNKPRIEYRNEITVTLAVNAWELALKGLLRQNRIRIFRKKQPNRPYESFALDQCLDTVRNRKLWPSQIDGFAVSANIRALSEYRNRAIHLYNADGLGSLLYRYMQQTVLNYRDFLVEASGKDLAEAITWDLLPLGATTPAEAVQFMRVDVQRRTIPEINNFIEGLRKDIQEVEALEGDTGRIYSYFDVAMHSKKNAKAADLAVAIDAESDGKIIKRDVDPNDKWPHTATRLLQLANDKRQGRKLSTYDRDALIWEGNLKDNPRHAWKHTEGLSHVWSNEAVAYFVAKDDASIDESRKSYSSHLANLRQSRARRRIT